MVGRRKKFLGSRKLLEQNCPYILDSNKNMHTDINPRGRKLKRGSITLECTSRKSFVSSQISFRLFIHSFFSFFFIKVISEFGLNEISTKPRVYIIQSYDTLDFPVGTIRN